MSHTNDNPWSTNIQAVISILSKATGIEEKTISEFIEIPPDPKMGDVATTISFHLAKEWKKNPALIASELVDKITKEIDRMDIIESVESKGPYINLFFNRRNYVVGVLECVKSLGEQYGKTSEYHAADRRSVDYALTLSWLAGFLSAANTYSGENATVQELLDFQRAVAELCEIDPSQTVFHAANDAYERLEQIAE